MKNGVPCTRVTNIGKFLFTCDTCSKGERRWKVEMREKLIEQKLVGAVKSMGGLCPKLISPGLDGMPDRLVLLPGGKLAFVEVKAPGLRPRPLQQARHGMLRRLGFKVFVLDNAEGINTVLSVMGGDAK